MLSVPYQVDSISVLTYSKEISAVISHVKTHTYSFLLNRWNARQPNRLQTGNSPVFIPFKNNQSTKMLCLPYLTQVDSISGLTYTQKKSVKIHHFPLRSKPLDEWDYVMDVVVQNEIQNKMVSTNM